jgi:diguanylate cyclase (GGDEF)-like protein
MTTIPLSALIIDDDELMRMMIAEALVPLGFTIIEAEDGELGVKTFLQHAPDLVFLDLLMPGINGIEVCRQLRSTLQGRTVPIVMVTGQDDRESINQSFQAGATDFISKPIHWPMLSHRVRFIMQSASAMRDIVQSEARLHQAQRLAGLGSFEYELATRLFHPSPNLAALLGMTGDENARLHHLKPGFSETDWALILELATHARDTGQSRMAEVQSLTGHSYRVQIEVFDDEGKLGLRGNLLDITDLRMAQDHAAYLERHDPLTGLLNHEGFVAAFDKMSALARRRKNDLPVLLIDLERLRRVRDGFGHRVADELMQAAAGRLNKCSDDLGMRSLRARITSDEIAVIFEGATEAESVVEAAEKMLATLEAPFESSGQSFRLQPAAGLAFYPRDADTSETVLKAARTALRKEGEAGRSLHFYDAASDATLTRRLRLEEDLRDALAHRHLELHYQPLVRVSDRQPVGVEALLRWHHPHLGPITPTEFIPIAEEIGLMHELGAWVLHEACGQAARWQADGIELDEMAVNVSGLQLADPEFSQRVAEALKASGLNPARLVLELTESVLVHDDLAAIEQLHRLKALGLRLALDDFGTGFSSMVSLTRLPIDVVKVDRSFVQAAPTERTAAAVVEAILALAGRLGMETVAEGVEENAQFDFLTSRGCTTAQGYMFQKPQSASDITRHLERTSRNPLKVLIVDDSRLSRLMLSTLIKTQLPNATIVEVDTATEAIGTIEREHPDLVTLDLNMPQMSGMEIAAAVRPTHPTLDIAMLTANFQDSIVQQARELNLRFFVKPITEQVVAGILAPYENGGRPS